jgi:hypothetical protein
MGPGRRSALPPGRRGEIGATEIRVASALVLLDERELAWYRKRTTAG